MEEHTTAVFDYVVIIVLGFLVRMQYYNKAVIDDNCVRHWWWMPQSVPRCHRRYDRSGYSGICSVPFPSFINNSIHHHLFHHRRPTLAWGHLSGSSPPQWQNNWSIDTGVDIVQSAVSFFSSEQFFRHDASREVVADNGKSLFLPLTAPRVPLYQSGQMS